MPLVGERFKRSERGVVGTETMYVKMAVGSMLTLLCVQSGVATVLSQSRPLKDSIAQAEVVAHVRIAKIETRQFRDGNRVANCGKDYVVNVLATFKGESRGQRTFAAHGQPHAVLFHEVKPGDELLVLLTPRRREQPPEGGPPDVVTGPPSLAEIQCRAQLGSMTLLNGEMGGFPLIVRAKDSQAGQQAIPWIAYDVTYTQMPESLIREQVLYDANCKGVECQRASRRMVPWLPLKTEIQRWVHDARQK